MFYLKKKKKTNCFWDNRSKPWIVIVCVVVKRTLTGIIPLKHRKLAKIINIFVSNFNKTGMIGEYCHIYAIKLCSLGYM